MAHTYSPSTCLKARAERERERNTILAKTFNWHRLGLWSGTDKPTGVTPASFKRCLAVCSGKLKDIITFLGIRTWPISPSVLRKWSLKGKRLDYLRSLC